MEYTINWKACPLFQGCAKETFDAVAALTAVAYKKKETVIPQKGIGVLLSGKLEVYGEREKGKLKLNELYPNDCFGFASLFGTKEGTSTRFKALDHSEILFIPETEVLKMMEEDPVFCKNILFIESEKIRFLNRKIVAYTSPTIAERLYCYLLTLPEEEDGTICLNENISVLSTRLGVGRTSIYRAFDILVKENKIVKSGKTLRIKQNEGETK